MNQLLISLAGTGAAVAVAAAAALIVNGICRRGQRRTYWIITLAVSLLFAGAAGMMLAVRFVSGAGEWASQKVHDIQAENAARKARETSHQQQVAARRAMLESGVPPAMRATEPADFYTYGGLYDWWRIPLRYPYELESIDTLDYATLGLYKGKGAVNDPDVSAHRLDIDGITHAAFDAYFLLMRRVDNPRSQNKGPVIWGLFNFETGYSQGFKTRDELLKAAAAAGYRGDTNLKTIQQCCDDAF